MTRPTRCLLADDHPALLAAVGELLERSGDEIVGPASDGPRAVIAAETEQPEVALVDYRMPRLSGAELIARLAAASPDTALVVYTAEADEGLVVDALGAGASAVVLKEAPLPDLIRAVETALDGRRYVDPALAPSGGPPSLRPRELDVLRLLAEGLSHETIGERLEITAETVRSHVRKASARLGASTRTQAVASALRLGLID
jgi:two-component system, NarL family, response regulator